MLNLRSRGKVTRPQLSCEPELSLHADDEALAPETLQQSSANLPAWLAYSSNGAGVAWAADKDMGALLHGFMLRYGALFDCARQTVDIGKVCCCSLQLPCCPWSHDACAV